MRAATIASTCYLGARVCFRQDFEEVILWKEGKKESNIDTYYENGEMQLLLRYLLYVIYFEQVINYIIRVILFLFYYHQFRLCSMTFLNYASTCVL